MVRLQKLGSLPNHTPTFNSKLLHTLATSNYFFSVFKKKKPKTQTNKKPVEMGKADRRPYLSIKMETTWLPQGIRRRNWDETQISWCQATGQPNSRNSNFELQAQASRSRAAGLCKAQAIHFIYIILPLLLPLPAALESPHSYRYIIRWFLILDLLASLSAPFPPLNAHSCT